MQYYAVMRIRVNLAGVGISLLACLAFSTPARADGSDWLRVGKDGWLPSFALTGGVFIQKQEASAESFCENGGGGREPFTLSSNDPGVPTCLGLYLLDPTLGAGMANLKPTVSSSNEYVAPSLGINLELATPTVGIIPGDPRFFVSGGADFYFGVLKNIANDRDPTGVRLPDIAQGANENAAVFALLGTGSRVSTEIQTVGWSAGGGIAFPFEFLGRRIWLKPGAAWSRQEFDVDFRVEAGIKNDPLQGANIRAKSGDQLRIVSLRTSDTLRIDGLGPSLEIEMDVIDFGPIGASLFINGAAYKVLGNRKLKASDQTETFAATAPTTCCPAFPPGDPLDPGVPARGLPEDTYSANWSFEVDPWFYRANVGLRFHWIGF